ncbi:MULTISPECIES: response regulator transcription factor [Nitrospirillum]|uniref:DNA-binding response OmpR family regulator n=1 Tax=Nitrospirillum amazonense TaxID=28077 RepID=A0A560FG36_9PROT|nr:response regulator transcription factor [Nitrospirillum amazonense]MEC4594162.1 response regulator transcription factor [Nitrospirillum amazonense]TWB20561.1 DNA-binding response OmpR family regulator [Nitrospirillum amazonense]
MTTPGAKKLLLVEDDETLRHLLAEQLTALEEFDVRQAAQGATALAAAQAVSFEAILLASRLPDMDGAAVCAALRQAGVDCPILLMAAEGEPDVAGCSDRLVKPFRIGTLLAKLRQHARPTGDDPALRIGPYEFRAVARTLREDGTGAETRLTDKEAQILAYLHRAEGAVISREQLLEQVWNYNEGVTTHTLETHIYRLRQKMERDPANAVLLVTEPGGYRLAP